MQPDGKSCLHNQCAAEMYPGEEDGSLKWLRMIEAGEENCKDPKRKIKVLITSEKPWVITSREEIK